MQFIVFCNSKLATTQAFVAYTAKNDIDLLQVVNLQVKSRPYELDIRFVNISLLRKKSIVSLDAAYLSP